MYIKGEDVNRRYPIMRTWGMSPTILEQDLIPAAEAELNGLLAGAFSVPITDGGSSWVIKDIAIELAYCKALFTKDPKQWETRHKAIVDRIDGITSGRETIDVGSGGLASDANEAWSSTMAYQPVHGMADPEDSRVDPYQIQDQKDGTIGPEEI